MTKTLRLSDKNSEAVEAVLATEIEFLMVTLLQWHPFNQHT